MKKCKICGYEYNDKVSGAKLMLNIVEPEGLQNTICEDCVALINKQTNAVKRAELLAKLGA